MYLSEPVTPHHHESVACQCRPCTSHISPVRDQQVVDRHGHGGSAEGDPGAGQCAVGQFVPDRQVVVDPEEDLGQHKDRYHTQSFEVFGVSPDAHEMLPDIQKQGYTQEAQAADDHEELHHARIGALCANLFGLPEEERLCAHPKGLDEENDEHGEFVIGAVDPVGGFCGFHSSVESVDDHESVDRFVDHPAETHDQQGGCVGEHLHQQASVDPETKSAPAFP